LINDQGGLQKVAYSYPTSFLIKMANNKISLPSSTAGITRYYEDYKSKIEFKPGHIIVFAVIILLITLFLHMYGSIFLQ